MSVKGNLAICVGPPNKTAAETMSLLHNLSVRTILATVFLVLAAGICGSLGWQFYDAWDESVRAERASALAAADKAVFTATYEIRNQRSGLLAAVQSSGDFAKAIDDAQKKAQEAYDAGAKAVEATPGVDAKALLAPIRDRWGLLFFTYF